MEPRRIEWLTDWDRRVKATAQRAYVESELRRLKADGQPVLYAALTAPLPEQRDLALSVLRHMQPTVYLRLAEGAAPPPLDPQGRPLPPGDRGRVLVAKVGTRGQAAPGEVLSDEESARYAGPNRAAIARTAEGLYRTVRVGPEPTPLAFEHALAVMSQWGHGVQDNQYRRRRNPERQLDQWLCVECDPAGRALGEPEAPAEAPKAHAPHGKRAA